MVLAFECYDHAGNNMLAMLFVGIELSSPAAQHMRLSGLGEQHLGWKFS